jgi:hypothetical protein
MLAAILAVADPQPALQAVPLEESIAKEKDPNGKHIMVQTHILVLNPNVNNAMHVKFVDVKGSAGVNIKKFDPKLNGLKAGTTILVTGELHYGAVGGQPSVRYKVKEVGGRKYNDHRHWRTDKAIYIIKPTFEVCPAVTGPAKADAPAKN